MKSFNLIGAVAACFYLGLAAPLAAEPAASAPEVPVWRQQQIATAQPVNSENTPSRSGELRGTEVRSLQNEAFGSVDDIVMSQQTGKIAYLVIARDESFGIEEKYVPVPWGYFKITPDANLLVLDTTKGAFDAAPRINQEQFKAPGIDLQSQKVDTYWKARFSDKGTKGSKK